MSKWTNERVELLTKLWCEGKTAKEIATVLGEGLTRNAVIGKAHRLKLSGRVSPIQANKSVRQSAIEDTAKKAGKLLETTRAAVPPSKSKKITKPKIISGKKTEKITKDQLSELADKGYGPAVSMVDLKDNMCKWPIGDPQEDGFHFCGANKDGGASHPYCPNHEHVAYNANVRTRKIVEVDESAGASRRDETDEMLASVGNS